MPIVKECMIGDSVSASAFCGFDITFDTGGAVVNTDTFTESSPLRVKGLPTIAVQVEEASTAFGLTFTVEAAIRAEGGALQFFKLFRSTIAAGAFELVQLSTPVDYIRVQISPTGGNNADCSVRVMAAQ